MSSSKLSSTRGLYHPFWKDIGIVIAEYLLQLLDSTQSTKCFIGLSMACIAVTTNLAAAGGAVAAMIVIWIKNGKPDLNFTLIGALAGLVAITAGCAVVSPASAIVIGAIGGLSMIAGTILLEKAEVDDPVGAIPVHGFAGVWGGLSPWDCLPRPPTQPSLRAFYLAEAQCSFMCRCSEQ